MNLNSLTFLLKYVKIFDKNTNLFGGEMNTNSKRKQDKKNRQKFSIQEWQSFGDTVRGNGKNRNGQVCKHCHGTGLKQVSKDGEPHWCGCWRCENNASKYLVEE
ncbi:MAG TPA: hypothetical protein PKL13_03205 [bacterium]|nr:hypothetical protein [bacterium]